MPVAATLGFVSAAFAASALGGALGMASGIALFALLPVARVALLSDLLLRERDILRAAISVLVLAIIAASFLLGLLASGGATPG